jgi:hypothetical protein
MLSAEQIEHRFFILGVVAAAVIPRQPGDHAGYWSVNRAEAGSHIIFANSWLQLQLSTCAGCFFPASIQETISSDQIFLELLR